MIKNAFEQGKAWTMRFIFVYYIFYRGMYYEIVTKTLERKKGEKKVGS